MAGDHDPMKHIAFFGHDAGDAAVQRRIRSLADEGMTVTGYTMRRRDHLVTPFQNHDLGRTYDGAFGQRIRQVFKGARIAAIPENRLADADIIYARNLDMLACAFLAKRYARLRTPVIYEALDIHRLMVRRGPIGWLLRGLERALLKRCKGLVVSSPAFLRNYFEVYHKGLYRAALIENRLVETARPPRPLTSRSEAGKTSVLTIGWVGILRCQRSFDLLCALADKFGPRLQVRLHGKPARNEIPVFEAEIDARPNMSYAGPYKAPEDLPDIYAGLDLVWAGDFMEAGFNSVWLLPNRIYEGGYFGTPPIAVAGTETARWVDERQCGFVVKEPLETQLPDLIAQLLDAPDKIDMFRTRLASLPEDVFIQPKGALSDIIDGFFAPKAAA